MQFSNFSRIEDGITITFKNEIPLEKVAVIKFFKDNSNGLFTKKEFRWSFNNAYWSSWETLTQNAFSSLNMHGNFYLFLQVRYTQTALGSGTVTSFSLTYTESDAISPTNPAHFHDDIETGDASAVLIHDIIQHHTFATITDASTLNGYPGSYYLNRAHHNGVQLISSITGLQTILTDLQGAAGVSYNYVDGSLYQRDVSINYLYDYTTALENYVDASLVDLKNYDDTRWIDINRMGFMNQTDTSRAFDPNTYTFTLSTSTGYGSWKYMWKGIEYTIDHDVSIQLFSSVPAGTQTKFIYIDSSDGILQDVGSWTLLDTKVPVAVVLYNSTASPIYQIVEERHSCLIDRRMHYYLHSTVGTQILGRSVLTGPDIGAYSDSSTTMRITTTRIIDEDIVQTIRALPRPNGSTASPYTIFYRYNASWTWQMSEVPFLYDANYIQWDNDGSLNTGNPDKFYNYYLLYTTMDGSAGFMMVPGRGEFNSLEDAKQENPLLFNWDQFQSLLPESVIGYQFTWETSAGATNKGKAALADEPRVINATTPRRTVSIGTGIYHNILAGLQGGSADASDFYHLDASQYHNVVNSSFGGNYVSKSGDTMTGNLTVYADVDISGNLTAISKSFLINHPLKPGVKLQYGNLEGPEHAIYVRGKYNRDYIDLPLYWMQLVDQSSITVNLTSTQKWSIPYVKEIKQNRVHIGKLGFGKLKGFYTIYAERKDIPKLITEKQN